MYAIRIDGKAFNKNCTHIRTKGKIMLWQGVQNSATSVKEEMELSTFPYAGKRVFRVYNAESVKKNAVNARPEYWLVGE